MEPVVYDFAINERGTCADLLTGDAALMPAGLLHADRAGPAALRAASASRPSAAPSWTASAQACRTDPQLSGMVQSALRPAAASGRRQTRPRARRLAALLDENGFDRVQHEQIRADLRSGRIGLAQNRLPVSSRIEDVRPDDVTDLSAGLDDPALDEWRRIGLDALADGQAAVLTLAGGAGSRWTQGAGVVKALNPFARLGGRHRSFLEVHLAKSRRAAEIAGAARAAHHHHQLPDPRRHRGVRWTTRTITAMTARCSSRRGE